VEAVSLVMDDLVGLLDPKTSDFVTAKMRRELGDPQGDPQELMRRLGAKVAISRESSGPALEGAEHYLLSVVELRRRKLGTHHRETLRAEIALARVHQQRRRSDRAEPLLRRAFSEFRRTLGETHDDTLHARTWLASLYLDLGRYDEVRTLLTDAIPHMRHGMLYSYDGLINLYNLGCALAHLGETETALLYLREALECGFQYEVLQDEQLEILHGHPQFEALVGEAGYVRHLWRAKEAAGVGDREGALSALRASVDGGLSSTVELRFSNAFLPFLHDPDFVALIREIEGRPRTSLPSSAH
jgi:tetratricopeptide (TPR) repeat protein